MFAPMLAKPGRNRPRVDDDDGDMEVPDKKKPIQRPAQTPAVFNVVKKEEFDISCAVSGEIGVVYHIYISSQIDEACKYTELLELFRSATANDEIHIHLNTPGGYLNTTQQIIAAMESSDAKIVTYAEGMVASAGTLILLAGFDIIINDGATLMFHYYSSGMFGKGSDLESHVNFNKKHVRRVMEKYYIGFLTPAELDDMFKGSDFWLSGEDCNNRLESYLKRRTLMIANDVINARRDMRVAQIESLRAALNEVIKPLPTPEELAENILNGAYGISYVEAAADGESEKEAAAKQAAEHKKAEKIAKSVKDHKSEPATKATVGPKGARKAKSK